MYEHDYTNRLSPLSSSYSHCSGYFAWKWSLGAVLTIIKYHRTKLPGTSSLETSLMVELLATVIRNSLFPVRSAFKSTSSAAASMGGAMHHHHQLLFFSPNFFMPSPRRAKGKEKEGEEPRLRRVLQCREWSCGTTRNLLCCPGVFSNSPSNDLTLDSFISTWLALHAPRAAPVPGTPCPSVPKSTSPVL